MSEQKQNFEHPEWEKENSLTSNLDRDRVNKWKPEQSAPVLSDEQTNEAMKVLNNTDFIDKFPRVDRTYADPILSMQLYGLISFTPAKGATPNENGVYGFAKLRGNFASEIEASQRAEFLIKNIDSYHQIYHTYVGRPFPITNSSKYSAETTEVDIRKQTAESVSQNVREKRLDEEKEIREIKQREEKLLEETKREEIDTYDDYITQKVKLAQLSFTYLEHQKKMEEVKGIIINTRELIKKLDDEFPDYKTSYYEKYMQARRDAGIKETSDDLNANFLKFLVQDAELGF
jgi:hypothetical protein